MKKTTYFRLPEMALLVLTLIALSQLSCSSVYRAVTNRPARSNDQKPAEAQWNGLQPNTEPNRLAIEMMDYLKHGNFRAIETRAEKYRASKERFPGGAWKIRVIYDGLTYPKEANLATDAIWNEHFDRLKRWKEQSPDSITPSVALAESYINYGLEARGSEFANKVSNENWKLFQERFELARNELFQAEKLEQKCPHWYTMMLLMGRYDGLDKGYYDSLFDKAVAYEPLYYYSYREKVMYLWPQWYGKPGEWEKFAAESTAKVKGKEGSALYFLVAGNSAVYGMGKKALSKGEISWDKLKQGYVDMEALYGTSDSRLNEVANLAMSAKDIHTSCAYVEKIGDNLDEEVWKKETFEGYKRFCLSVKTKDPTVQIAKEKMPPENEQHP